MTSTAIRMAALATLLACSLTFAASRATAQQANTLRVSLSLRDGSRIVGYSMLDSIGLQTQYAALHIPLRLINVIEFSRKGREAILSLTSGEKLIGVVTPTAFPVRSLVGAVSIRQDDISTIALLQKMSYSDCGLIAFYPLHGDAKDKTGHGHDGTVKGAKACPDQSGRPNSAYCFDGKDAYISIPDGIVPHDVSAFSISAWMLTSQLDKQSIAIYLGAAEGEAVIQTLNSRLVFTVNIANTIYNATTDIPVNTWVHIVGVYRRGQSSEIWLNGERMGQTPLPPGDLVHGHPEHNSAIGSYAPAQVNHKRGYSIRNWLGAICNVRIYTRALESATIQSLYVNEN